MGFELTYSPLFRLVREGVEEIVGMGVALAAVQDRIVSAGNSDPEIVTRSTIKPWQAIASGVFDDRQRSPAILMGAASPSGQAEHIHQLHELASQLDVDANQLQLPAVYPMDSKAAAGLEISNQEKQRLYHPCAGKHLLYAWACGSTQTYLDLRSPVHERLVQRLDRLELGPYRFVTDSCGLPSLVLSAQGLLELWSSLRRQSTASWQRLKELWVSHPNWIGGEDRLDSSMTRWTSGAILAKEGADGLLAGGTCRLDDANLAFVIKTGHGYQPQYAGLVLWRLLDRARTDLPPHGQRLLASLERAKSAWVSGGHEIEFGF